jgi:3-phenylpropionate/trans-cinnamate dioxygenase ferredoxin subunit
MAENVGLEVDVSDLGPGQKRPLEHAGVEILLCNVDGDFFAVENVCSHAAVPLSEGTLQGCELECDFHGAVFDVRDGSAIALPAKDGLRTFAVEPTGPDGRRVRIHV